MSMDGKRVADDGIYLDGKDIERPKEIFIFLGNLLEALTPPKPISILDAGCAAGAYVHYLNTRFPQHKTTGMDVSPALVDRARVDVPDSDFFLGSLLNPDDFTGMAFDVVSCSGVLSIFDEVKTPLTNLLSCTKEGGSVYINTIINDDPIDVLMRYRRSAEQGDWEIGWNIFSKHTIEETLRSFGGDLSWAWHPFQLPFDLEKKPDPMRTWTIQTESHPHQLVNGACQMINMQVLHVVVNKKPTFSNA